MRQWLVAALMVSLSAAAAFGADVDQPVHWPQWRGPDLDGSSRATGLPVTWSETENIVWKVPLPSWSGATSIIWGDRVFVTSPADPKEGRAGKAGRSPFARPPGGDTLLLLCLNKADGSLRWKRELGGGNCFRMKHNMSSPSPVTDGKHVWAMTGTGVLACFDIDGKEIWRRNVQDDYGRFGLNHGFASSPLLLEDKVVVQVLHGMTTDDPSYVFAVDKLTGKTVWKLDRWTDAIKESPDGYSTPTVLRYADRCEIVVTGGDYATGHDPGTGREVWRVGGLNPNPKGNPAWRTINSPLACDDMVYASGRATPIVGIRAGGKGRVTDTHTVWKYDRGPDVPTPVCDGKHVYVVRDKGFMVCLDAKSGKAVWGPERFAKATHSASPLLAEGRIYVTSERGTTTVLAAGPEFKVLATNQLDDDWVLASFAVSEGRLYLRASKHLYCIAAK